MGQLGIGKGWSFGGMTIPEGQVADFTVSLYNQSGSSITLINASVIAGPGVIAPNLVHLGVLTGNDIVGAGTGWPPKGSLSPIVSLRNHVARDGLTNIAVSLAGSRKNVAYGIIGLRIQFTIDGVNHIARVVGSGGVFCVADLHNSRAMTKCNKLEQDASQMAANRIKS
jgi:hypothetical protein